MSKVILGYVNKLYIGMIDHFKYLPRVLLYIWLVSIFYEIFYNFSFVWFHNPVATKLWERKMLEWRANVENLVIYLYKIFYAF